MGYPVHRIGSERAAIFIWESLVAVPALVARLTRVGQAESARRIMSGRRSIWQDAVLRLWTGSL